MPLRFASAQSAPANLKVGLILPMSGAQALIGQMCKHGADIANDVFADIKVPVKLDIQTFDTETKPDVARTQAEKAVDAGCHVLVGAFDSGQTIAIAQVAEQKGVPLVVNIAAAPPITESGYKFIVRNFPTAPMLLERAPSTCRRRSSRSPASTPKTAVLLSINDTFGSAMMGGIKAMFPKAGMPYEIVDDDHLRRRRQGPVGRGRQGQGQQGRDADADLPAQRRQADRPGDGEAALGADGHQSRHARHVRAGLHQDAWASTASTRCRSNGRGSIPSRA